MQAKILARSAVAVVSVISLGLASYYTLRLAVADQHYRANTLADLSRAVELDPLNARMWTWLAEHQEHAGLDSTAALRTAASLSPFDAAPKIRLGLRAELAGATGRRLGGRNAGEVVGASGATRMHMPGRSSGSGIGNTLDLRSPGFFGTTLDSARTVTRP